MAKQKRKNKKSSKVKNSNLETNYKSSVILVGVIILVLILFYLLTVVILNKRDFVVNNNTSIQYSKILAGESFDLEEEDYLVFYFDMNKNADYTDLISNYREKNNSLPLYIVNLAEGLNKSIIADEDNIQVTKSENLKIKDSLIIRFKNNEISDYTTSSFENFLDNNVE